MPEQPQDTGVVNVHVQRPGRRPESLPPPKMVTVTPSAEMGPRGVLPEVPESQIERLGSTSSIQFHVPPLTAPPVKLGLLGTIVIIGVGVALAPAGA